MTDRFIQSQFFPNNNDKSQSALDQCVRSGLPVFSEDMIENHGAKRFFACGYDYFCNIMYKRKKPKHVYEVLQWHLPTKIFFDFDEKDMSKREDFKCSVKKYLEHVSDKLGGDVTYVILHASTEKKCSMHVIFQIFLENMQGVKQFVKETLEECPCPYVDESVYGRNRSFRLLHSKKKGKSDSSTLIRTSLDEKYCPNELFETLIQSYEPTPRSCFYDKYKHEIQIMSAPSSPSSSSSCSSSSPGIMLRHDPFQRFIEPFGGKIISVKECEHFVSCIIGNMKCAKLNRYHGNNNQFMRICKSSGRGWFRCSDTETCKGFKYHAFDGTFLLTKIN